MGVTSDVTLENRRMLLLDVDGTEVIITVTSTPSIVRKWISNTLYFNRHHRYRLVVGLGVQWTPGHTAGPAATLQLCVGRRCLVFQLYHSATVPRLLRRFLSNPNYTFVGLWNHSDAKRLVESKHELFMFRDPLDLRKYAVSERDGSRLNRDKKEIIVIECLGMNMRFDEDISMSDWEDEDLSEKQIEQAAMDAYCSFLIGLKLEAWKYTLDA